MNTFLTADTHYGHSNILKFTNRHKIFNNIEEHDEALIERWNSIVGPNDEVYHIGDVAFARPDYIESILRRLNGKIYFIKGNHDKICLKESIQKRFEWTKVYHELKYGYNGESYKIVLFHYPIQDWNGKYHGSMHAHGHSHQNNVRLGRRMDVGVDNPIANYAPIPVESFIDEMLKIDWELELQMTPNNQKVL